MTTPDLALGLLVLARIAGMVFAAPVLSERIVPIPVKAGLSLSLALMFLPFVSRPAAMPDGAWALAVGASGELAIGVLIGFAAAIVLAAAKGAGRMIEQQVGLPLSGDAVEGSDESAWVGFSGLLVAVVFFAINGHHHLIAGTLGSFGTIPVLGTIGAADGGVRLVGQLGLALFGTSLHLAGPVIVTMLLVSLAAGFVARAVPELDGTPAVLGARAALGIVAVCVGIGSAMSGFASAWMSSSPQRVLEFVGGHP